jgi:uncharacterized protein with ATP-grasp and redox domains
MYLDCVPCFVRQGLELVRNTTDDEALQEKALREMLLAISRMDLSQSPPAMGQILHRLARSLLDDDDPYRQIKHRFNELALRLYPTLKSRVEDSPDPLTTAVRFAIAGNIIDSAAKSHLCEADVENAIQDSLELPLRGDLESFRRAVTKAERILYLCDNAGEILFDKLLIEQLPYEKVTVSVRGFPVINDATMIDAEAAGLTTLVEVIDNGSDAPGTLLDDCSRDFRQSFRESDLVIAKGQGNYESLSEVRQEVFFLLKVKCPVIAGKLGYRVGDMALCGSFQLLERQKRAQ